LISASIFVFIY